MFVPSVVLSNTTAYNVDHPVFYSGALLFYSHDRWAKSFWSIYCIPGRISRIQAGEMDEIAVRRLGSLSLPHPSPSFSRGSHIQGRKVETRRTHNRITGRASGSEMVYLDGRYGGARGGCATGMVKKDAGPVARWKENENSSAGLDTSGSEIYKRRGQIELEWNERGRKRASFGGWEGW